MATKYDEFGNIIPSTPAPRASYPYASTTVKQRVTARDASAFGDPYQTGDTPASVLNTYIDAQLPSQGINPKGWSAFADNSKLPFVQGYDPKTNQIWYEENGVQMKTGDLTNTQVSPTGYTNLVGNTPTVDIPPATTSAFAMPDMKDLGSILGAAAQIGSYFNARDTNKENKRMNDAKLSEFARLKDKDEAFSRNMNASGLGTRA